MARESCGPAIHSTWTFSTVPAPVRQLYTVFGDGGGPTDKIYPCAFTLLPNKKTETYNHAFYEIKNLLNYSPKTIHIDFEQAVVKSTKHIFPDCDIRGCFFHWKKSIYTNSSPLFAHSMWNTMDRILSDRQTTTNALESWHSRWTNSLSTNHSTPVIRGFMNKDSLARSKFQEIISRRATNPNPSRKDRRSERLEKTKVSLENYKADHMNRDTL